MQKKHVAQTCRVISLVFGKIYPIKSNHCSGIYSGLVNFTFIAAFSRRLFIFFFCNKCYYTT